MPLRSNWILKGTHLSDSTELEAKATPVKSSEDSVILAVMPVFNAMRYRETTVPALIESAVELSDKYAHLSKQNTELQRLNQDLKQENAQFKVKIQTLETELKQVETQLDESNRLVMDLNAELQIWKKDILGFRSEMRAAATAQINALMKIMNAMGVEASPEAQVPEGNLPEQGGAQ